MTTEKVFESDEMQLLNVNLEWSEEELLGKEGIFFLKDIVRFFGLNSSQLKARAKALNQESGNAWKVIGIRKQWSHWIVRMKVFAPYFRKNLISNICKIDETWDGNTLLKQQGIFPLTEVCKYIPFSPHQIRYQVRKFEDSKERFGVWKCEADKIYLVDMEVFSKWIREIWQGNFGRSKS